MKTRGISFIEVIISLLLISIVMSGFFWLKQRQLQQALNIKQQLSAHIALADLAERMLANNTGVKNNFYRTYTTPTAVNCFNINCNSEQIAKFDIYNISNNWQDSLPAMKILINKTADDYRLQINWQGITQAQSATLDIKTIP